MSNLKELTVQIISAKIANKTLIFATLIILIPHLAVAANWIEIAGTDKLFDSKSIKLQNNKYYKVWIKYSLAPSDVDELVKSNQKYSNYSYSVTSWAFDCNNKMSAFIGTNEYSENGNVIYSTNDDNFKLKDVTPDTYGELVLNQICYHISSTKPVKRRANSK